MGNTNVREGGVRHPQAPGGAVGGGPRGVNYGVPQPPGGHGQQPQQGRLGHAPSTESMSQSPSESPGSAARSPLMFTPQVGNWVPLFLWVFQDFGFCDWVCGGFGFLAK